AGAPTARAERVECIVDGPAALDRFAPPWVLKADGLAAGKGVCVTSDRLEAERFLSDCLERDRFGAEGEAVVIEEFLRGEEISWMVVADGTDHVPLVPAHDFKRAEEGDRGAHTGGMGAFAPAAVDARRARRIAARTVSAAVGAMSR